MTLVRPDPEDDPEPIVEPVVVEVLFQPAQHLHFLEQANGSVRVRACIKTDCDKAAPLSGTMAEVFASVKR